jgi:Glycosyl transferase family 2
MLMTNAIRGTGGARAPLTFSRMPGPSVSFVIATYNRPDWLRLSMDSVLDQDYPELELLVVDDGSTGETAEVLEEYASRHPPERFRYTRHENMGQARTLNRGYEMTRGDLVGYLPDDDLLLPGAVSELVAALRDPEVICAYGGWQIIEPDGRVIDTIRPMKYSPLEAYRQIDTVIAPGGLVRRDVLLSTGGWDPSQYYMPDFLLWMKVGLAGPVVRVDRPVVSWRRHEGGLSEQSGIERWHEFLQLVELGEDLLELPAEAHSIRAEAFRNACIQAAFFMGGTGPPPGERFAAIDLGRPATSAFSSGIGRTEWPDQRSDESARMWRELAHLTLELGRARGARATNGGKPGVPGDGLRTAREHLRRVGALPGDDEDPPGISPDHDIRMDLMEAAVACEEDIDPDVSRFLVIERGTGAITDAEFEALNKLGYYAPVELLDPVVEDRRRKLEELTSRPAMKRLRQLWRKLDRGKEDRARSK